MKSHLKSFVGMAALTVAFFPVALTSASAQSSPGKMEQNSTGTSFSSMDTTFRQKASMSDMFEIEASRLALEKSQSASVKQFAQQMITDHEKTLSMLRGGSVSSSNMSNSSAVTGGYGSGNLPDRGDDQTGSTTDSGSSRQTSGDPGRGSSANTGKMGTQSGIMQGGSSAGTTGKYTSLLDAEHSEKLNKLSALQGIEFDRQYIEIQRKAHEDAVALFTRESESGTDAALKSFAQNTLPHLKEHLTMAKALKS